MARLPDRFDLWVRKAQQATDPARQVDMVLGALVSRDELCFLNIGTKEQPRMGLATYGRSEDPKDRFATVFSDVQRLAEFAESQGMLEGTRFGSEAPVIVSPMASGLDWCVDNKAGLLINPSQGDTVIVAPDALATFVTEWKQRGGRQAAGFWIPSMTSEEEDFWQENGL